MIIRELMGTRRGLMDIEWYQQSGSMAIADVMFVEGIGICSHQPGPHYSEKIQKKIFRMRDINGFIHDVEESKIFEAFPKECRYYWRNEKPALLEEQEINPV